MAQIDACEFMVKGYHYTKPTSPSRTDSCRLYIDTSISTESDSTIAAGTETWTVPGSATLTSATKDTSTYQVQLKGIHRFNIKR